MGYAMLQWGRGIDAAEMVRLTITETKLAALQWGRGIDAAEIVWVSTATVPEGGFNGAAASMPRK